MKELVPWISADWMNNSIARLAFIPNPSILYQVTGNDGTVAMDAKKFIKTFGELALLICEEVGHNCSESEISKEVAEIYLFVVKIFNSTTEEYQAEEKKYNSIFLHRLSEVDALVSSVNWTKYLLKTVPAIHHSYIINDPIVIAAKTQQETINSILLSTRKEVIVNYAMLLYTLSWIEYMDEKYRGVVKARGKDDVCLRITLLRFRETIIANYERRTNGNIEAYFADGVFVGAQNVAVPSKASFTKFVGNRGDAEPLSGLLVADAVCTSDTRHPS
ncbi:hypothetical protein ANCCEY_10631 [Ancylostoma ceylanicum]|uniref:Peptidase M13 N-terminal domain-containing protein n=1 Tax=Ancylostoma ceylanicum TaxID=53326 RepID=A0A0D6LJX8_9BILA|nr:hypothetical protein ANCCEY_10631 [Ancylostoma ceylanicum]